MKYTVIDMDTQKDIATITVEGPVMGGDTVVIDNIPYGVAARTHVPSEVPKVVVIGASTTSHETLLVVQRLKLQSEVSNAD